MKAIVLYYKDADPGATANDLTLRAEVTFAGTEAEIPGRVFNDLGPEGNGLGFPISFSAIAQYPNVIEDALIARVAQLITDGKINAGTTLARTDCFFPSYTRGA